LAGARRLLHRRLTKSPEVQREELTPVVAENVSSLKEFDYFTFAEVDGEKAAFKEPADCWGEFNDGMFTLHFFLPLSAPAKAARLNSEIFDPEFFIDFTLAEADSVTPAGAPTDCSVAVTQRPDPAGPSWGERLSSQPRCSPPI
jgi:ABC-type uncharacterized transport system substrate-binding protein